MKIILSASAEKNLKKISKMDQIAITKKIRKLQKPPIFQEEKIKGFQHIFRVRVGNYRIVYRRIPRKIYIVLIAHRKDVYDLLRRLL